MDMEYGDGPFFKDGVFIYSTGQMVNEGYLIEGDQSRDFFGQFEGLEKREE
jgi:hypothetical protein